MELSFVGQGLGNSDNQIGVLLSESFENEKYTQFTCLVAFARSSGIKHLTDKINKSKNYFDEYNIIVGVDQDGTSKEALEDLLELDIDTSVYHTQSPVTFHPKIYIFEGPSVARIILGSSNLTKSGLFQSIESSALVDFEKPDDDGERILYDIQEYYEPLLSGSSPNIHSLSSNLIDTLEKADLIHSEVDSSSDSGFPSSSRGDNVSEVDELFPAVNVTRPPAEHSDPSLSGSEVRQIEEIDTGRGDLLWKKPDLPASDAQDMRHSNITGQLRFSQAGWKVDGEVIDQTIYFRYNVFSNLDWQEVETNPIVESARVIFHVDLRGEHEGYHELEIIHKPVWEAEQRNVTTMLRWGELNQKVRDLNLTGATFYLYGPNSGSEPYHIEIG